MTPEGQWATVPVKPDSGTALNSDDCLPILVNIGDLLSYWTGGLLKSTVHRVTFPVAGKGPAGGEDRYSIAYFCHPLDEAELSEIPSEMVTAHRQRLNGSILPSKPMTAKDHLNSRLAATYGIK